MIKNAAVILSRLLIILDDNVERVTHWLRSLKGGSGGSPPGEKKLKNRDVKCIA